MASSKARNQFKWTGDAHVALAVALARMHGTITPAEQEALVKDMNDNGFETSWEGIRQHLQKLKNGSTPANTPKKPASAAASKGTPTKGKRASATPTKRRKAHNVDEDDDEDDKDQKDLKKIKLELEAATPDQHFDEGLDDGVA